MKRNLFIFLMIILGHSHSSGQMKINELMPRNVSYWMNERYDFAGWVEVKNVSDSPVHVSDLFFSDGIQSWQCEQDSVVMPQGYFVFYFDEIGESNHANFKLEPEGGSLYLYDVQSGNLLDEVIYPEIYRNVSYGRLEKENDTWGYLREASIGETNENTFFVDRQTEMPQFSLAPGFYDSEVDVEIVSNNPIAKIYYTTDGTEPKVCDSLLYAAPIAVSKNTSIRSIAAESDALPSSLLTGTFFVGERSISLPVVSLTVDPKYFFDDDLGIYVVGNGRYNNPSSSCG